MEIRFVSHSGFSVSHGQHEILCDPWLFGRVFHEGWDVYAETTLGVEDLGDVRQVWFSHEHPDHFHVPSIRAFPPERRAEMGVLFQRTIDHRVADFCRGQGFADVRELDPGWIDLGDGLEIRCESFREGNSWIAFRANDQTILNLNDCGIRNVSDAQAVKAAVGDIDVLLTQFSYAFWVGNPPDRALREREARDKLEMVRFQCDQLEPAVVIPIASYVYFCHPENFYLNDAINSASATRDFLARETSSQPVVLYNGDRYEPGGAHATDEACARYDADLEQAVARGPLADIPATSYSFDDLSADADAFSAKLAADAPWYLRRLLKPARIHLWDHGSSVELSTSGLRPISCPEQEADVALHSESLALCLRNAWGIDTLGVSGRMHKPSGGNYRRFYLLLRPGLLAMRGERADLRYIAGSLANAALVKAGRRSN